MGRRPLSGAFTALANRNFRLYMFGQTVSQAGTWMQTVAQAWLVLRLTDSGTALGIVAALQAAPVLLFAPVGGLIVDRMDKRNLMLATQSVAGLLAISLGVLTVTDAVRLWMVYGLALGLGLVNIVDNPVRQAFVLEVVGPTDLTNAVGLNNVTFNVARIVGPALAGVTISTIGIGPCFLVNGASYVAVLAALLLMHAHELHASPVLRRAAGQLREGFAYVRRTPELLVPVGIMFVIGSLTYETAVTLPLLAKNTFGGDAGTYSAMSVAMGIGAVLGGIALGTRIVPRRANLLRVSLALGAAMLLCAVAPTLETELALLVVLGGCSISFLAVANSTLQLSAPPHMRGRVMALWSIAFLGSAPVGGPAVGVAGQYLGARWAVAIGGIAPLVAVALALPAMRRMPGGLRAVAGDHLVPV